MSSIPSITEWIETALTTVAVRPELRDNLREEIEQWFVIALSVQVSIIDFLRGWRRSLILHTQDTFRAVMRVEMSIDEDFAAPAAAKGLGDEVKVVKGWLSASELFGTPQMLVEPAPSDAKPSETVLSVAEVSEEVVVQEEAVEVPQVVVTPFLCSSHLYLLTSS
jgi:hypothetical protein